MNRPGRETRPFPVDGAGVRLARNLGVALRTWVWAFLGGAVTVCLATVIIVSYVASIPEPSL